MITLNVAAGVLVFFVCLVLTASVIMLMEAQKLYRRSLNVMSCVYDWLEQEVKGHEGTD